MLAERTDKVLVKLLALVNVAADLANVPLLALGLRFGFNVRVVVIVCHSCLVGNNASLGHGAYEHTVSIKIYILLHGKGHKGIDVTGQEDKSVI